MGKGKLVTMAGLLMICLLVLSGCVTIETDFAVTKDGLISMSIYEKLDKELYAQYLNELYGDGGIEGSDSDDIINEMLEADDSSVTEEVIDGRTYLVINLDDYQSKDIPMENFYSQEGFGNGFGISETYLRIMGEQLEQGTTDNSYIPATEDEEQLKKYMGQSYLEVSALFDYPVTNTNGIIDPENPNHVVWKYGLTEDVNEIYAKCENGISYTGAEPGALYQNSITFHYEGAEQATVNGQAMQNDTIFSADGIYCVVLKNGQGQETICFAIDKEAPVLTDQNGNEITVAGWQKELKNIYLKDTSGIGMAQIDGTDVLDSLLTASGDIQYQVTLDPAKLTDGEHTLIIGDTYGNSASFIFKTDHTAPVVKGVKNGKKYKKQRKITFSDAGSGIKKALLNGKSIKSGKKVKKPGNYTLKVTDKTNNQITIKFRIKK